MDTTGSICRTQRCMTENGGGISGSSIEKLPKWFVHLWSLGHQSGNLLNFLCIHFAATCLRLHLNQSLFRMNICLCVISICTILWHLELEGVFIQMKGTKKESILFSFTRCEIYWDDYEMNNQVQKKKSLHGDSQHADTSKYLSLFISDQQPGLRIWRL